MIDYTKLQSNLSTLKRCRVALSDLAVEAKRIEGVLAGIEPEIESAMAQARMLAMPAPKRTGAPFESDEYRSPFGLFPQKPASGPEYEYEAGREPKPQGKGKPIQDLLSGLYHRINPPAS